MKEDIIKRIIDKLYDYEGSEFYGADLAYSLFEGENIDGSFTYNSYEAKEWIRDNFDEGIRELKQNLSKYLLMAEQEDIFITRNGKIVAKLTNPYQDRVDMAKSLFGIIPGDMTIEQAHRERLEKV